MVNAIRYLNCLEKHDRYTICLNWRHAPCLFVHVDGHRSDGATDCDEVRPDHLAPQREPRQTILPSTISISSGTQVSSAAIERATKPGCQLLVPTGW